MTRSCAPDPHRAYGEGDRRHRAGERQHWCATCELWQFEADMATCADARHDPMTEARLEAFYRKEGRRRR